MNLFLIKAKIKDVPEGRNRIRDHVFSIDKETALEKFRNKYNDPELIDWDQVEFESIEKIKEAE